jgi:uncharacterized protein YdeI (YjbR/CyaY-like superfamily)
VPKPKKDSDPTPRFFPTQASWRRWLAANHKRCAELWVGFWRVSTGRRSITWPQSVDEALCFGWIDGLRRRLDQESYTIRFSPRRAGSPWSLVNLKRYRELEGEGLVSPAGKAARAKWKASAGYSYERPRRELDGAALARLNSNPKARRFWEAQTPSYRKVASYWVTSGKREETREKRLATLIGCCLRGSAIPPLAKYVKMKKPVNR